MKETYLYIVNVLINETLGGIQDLNRNDSLSAQR
jgi:hypothetical protein